MRILKGWLHCSFKLHYKWLMRQDYWLHKGAVGVNKENKMGYSCKTLDCGCMCLCMCHALGPIKMNSLPYYCMGK